MLKNKRTLMVAAVAVVGCAGLVVLTILPSLPGIGRANFARIEIGMTQPEVEELLGGPPSVIAPNGRDWGFLFLT